MKAMTGTSWGQQKETLTVTYNSLIKPIITYAAAIWYPSTCKSNIDSLQAIQNKALRIISGSLNMSDTHHLHAETKILPIEDHLDMLSTQFLASSLRPNHPSHPYVTMSSGPRAAHRKQTLQSRFSRHLTPHLQNGIIPNTEYKRVLADIHSSAVNRFRINQRPNRVLGSSPPDINPEESQLHRLHRTTLSQLRSGFCSRLQDYRHRIDLSDTDLCPECQEERHTVCHLFECRAHPTQLTTEDLWTKPVEVAALLTQMRAFAELPPVDPPVPPPPPEPPPSTLRGPRMT